MPRDKEFSRTTAIHCFPDLQVQANVMSHERYISSLVEGINSSTKALEASGIDGNDEARARALESARKLTAALATPAETVLHHSYEVMRELA